jgi:L-aminopeptidase/D-esterase-like protein
MEQQPSHARPGARNLITDVPGLKVGQAQDVSVRSGVTVILPDERAVCACDVRGGAPGTRETDALAPENLVEAVDAVVLSGGSVYGLAAADGVAAWLGARGAATGCRASPGRRSRRWSRRQSCSTSPTAATRPGARARPIAHWA